MDVITNDINIIIQALKSEEVVAIPTETVYGLAGSLFSEKAIKKIFEIKKRPYNCPLSVAVKTVEEIKFIAKDIPEEAKILIKNYLPGPLTLILKKQDIISDVITSESEYVGVRVSENIYVKNILSEVPFPIVLTSANVHNKNNCTNALQVQQQFKDTIKYIFDGGECEIGKESTIVSFRDNKINIVRRGAIDMINGYIPQKC